MMKNFLPSSRMIVASLALLSLGACSNMDQMQQRMVSGGAIGVASGAVGTVLTGGCIACGMAIGGAVGTAGGFIVDEIDNNTRSSSSPPPSSFNSSSNSSYNNSSNTVASSSGSGPVYTVGNSGY